MIPSALESPDVACECFLVWVFFFVIYFSLKLRLFFIFPKLTGRFCFVISSCFSEG